MTYTEMKRLKVDDEVVDIKLSISYKKVVVAKVKEVREDAVILVAVNKEDAIGYPHRFTYRDDFRILGFKEQITEDVLKAIIDYIAGAVGEMLS